MSDKWLVCCGEEARADLGPTLVALGATNGAEFVRNPDDLRRIASQDPGRYSAAVGAGLEGVSAVNLAAALAHDGDFLQVALIERGASGSLRSRAARAGIDVVVDPGDLPAAGAREVPIVATTDALPLGAGGVSAPTGGTAAADAPDAGPSAPEPAPLAKGASSKKPLSVDKPLDGACRQPHVLPTPPQVKGRAPVIVLCSGRGGVGKTCLVAALAVAAAGWGLKVCALDLDLSCGNLFSCFGLPDGYDLARFVAEGGATAFERAGAAACEHVRLLGPCSRPELSENVMPAVEGLICAASSASDLVVVDTSTTFTDGVAQAVQLADRVLIVSDGGPGSAAATARTSGLAVRLGVARTRLARLENHASPRGRVAGVGIETGLEAARTFSVVEGGDEARELFAAGRASELFELGLPLADSAASVLAQVMAELGRLPDCDAARHALEAASPRKRSFFGRKREVRSA
ncbi:P-loop NTPase [Paratractidigestivibacter sp.]|uniref:nucleotide-binding protein n=1 Tax=Paratractidigestivibacter sp. TaxID=2847316 RepID=UPI002ABE889E|nr:P-loop NTPase [Paratractidigestivibacter sp.]